jgi:hypothetical protein
MPEMLPYADLQISNCNPYSRFIKTINSEFDVMSKKR